MPGLAREFLRRHALLIVVAAVGIAGGADYAVSVLFRPARAVMYDGHFVFADCNLPGAPAATSCVAQYEFILGNTGTQQEDILVVWPADIHDWTPQPRLQNIAADEPRGHDPDISCTTPADRTECAVGRLAPGALLILQLRCMPCSGDAIAAFGDAPPEIRTAARVHRGDPRVNALVRRLQVLFY